MENSNWSRNEFYAYVLLYAAQSNFIESEEEERYILSKIKEDTYNTIHTEIVHDSGYDSMKKIQNYIQCNVISPEEKQELMRDVKEVFFADSTVDRYEKSVFQILNQMFK